MKTITLKPVGFVKNKVKAPRFGNFKNEISEIILDKKFDVITFIHSFHHIGNTRRTLKEAKKVLEKKGQLIITEYSPERGKKEDNCRRFSIKFITDLLVKNNFTNINIEQPERGFFFLVAN